MISPSAAKKPTITVVIHAFNAEKFIAQTLDSVLMQKGYFDLEILIHDDASKDNTQTIISKYHQKYPKQVFPILQTENQQSKGVNIFGKILLPRVSGKYIAICDGDDYWVDPNKLQKQMDFLENHLDYSICYHDSTIVDENGRELKSSKLNNESKRDFTEDELIIGSWTLANTICFRNVIPELPQEYEGDTFLSCVLGQYGNGKYLNNIEPSAYRIHSTNTFASLTEFGKKLKGINIRSRLVRYYRRIKLDSKYEKYILHFSNNLVNDLLNNLNDETPLRELEMFANELHDGDDICDWSRALKIVNQQITKTKIGNNAGAHNVLVEKDLSKINGYEILPTGSKRVSRVIPDKSDIVSNQSFQTPFLNNDEQAQSSTKPNDLIFTVCIFTYNRASMLGRAIKSVLRAVGSDLELVIIDDGSTDDTKDIVAQFDDDPRLRYFYQEHAGAPAARNLAILKAIGNYMVWLGSDDEIAPGALDVYRRQLEQYPDVDIYYCDNVRLYDVSGQEQLIKHQTFQGTIPPSKFLMGPPLADGGSCVRKNLYSELGGYNKEFTRAQDYEFWVRASSTARFHHIPEVLYFHHIHDKGSLTPLFYKGVSMEFENRILDSLIQNHPIEAMHPEVNWSKLTNEDRRSYEALIYLEYASAYTKWENITKAENYLKRSKDIKVSKETEEVESALQVLKNKLNEKQLPITAIMQVYNEGDVIFHVIRDFVEQGIQVYFIDHHSTDNTLEEARKWLGKGVIKIETFPDDSGFDIPKDVFSLRYMLRRKEMIAKEMGPGWYIHTEADEFRESPWFNMNLREGIERVDAEGFNAINFKIYDFKPTDNTFPAGGDVREYLTHYDTNIAAQNRTQIKAWKYSGENDLNLWESGGHDVKFTGKKVYPIPFILRHYCIRSQEHGERKVFSERRDRFDKEERSANWHQHYDHIKREKQQYVIAKEQLIKFDRSTACQEILGSVGQSNTAQNYYEFTRPEIQALIEPTSKKILDIGCAAGKMAGEIKQKLGAEVWGIEPVSEAADQAKKHLDKVLNSSIEDALNELPNQFFDTIIFADVLEHLEDPYSILKMILGKLSPKGQIIASIPNVRHWSVLKDLLEGRWDYQDAGILDRTHLRFFTRKSIGDMFDQSGYEIMAKSATTLGDQGAPPQVVKALSQGGLDVSSLKEDSRHYQYLVKATPRVAASPVVDRKALVSIIMLTWNALKYTKKTIESIQKHTTYPHEIIFVDNASKDGTQKYLRRQAKKHPNFKLIENKTNKGFAAGNNQGVAAAQGQYIMLLNNDVLVSEGWLNELVRAFEKDEHIGMVGPITNSISGRQMVQEVPYKDVAGYEPFAEKILTQNTDKITPRRRIAGFVVLMEKTLYQDVGGLDESFGIGNYEDDDLCLKVRRDGYAIMVHEGVFIHHYGSQTFIANKIDYTASLKSKGKVFKQKWPNVDYEELIELKSPLTEAHPMMLQAGMVGLETGDYEVAYDTLKQLIDENPLHEDAFMGLIMAARITGRIEEAIGFTRRLIHLNPDNAIAYNLSGLLASDAGNYQAAQKLFRIAIEKDANLLDARRNYAEVLIIDDKFQEGVKAYLDIIADHPDDIITLLRMAELNIEAGRTSDAMKYAKLVLKVDPTQAQAVSILENMAPER